MVLVFGLFFAGSIINAGEMLAGRLPSPGGSWAEFAPAAVQELTYAGLAALVAILLSARRGMTLRQLGLGLPRQADGTASPGRTTRMGALALVALIIGAVFMVRLETGHLAQPAYPTGAYFVYAVAGSLQSGVVEEMIALAFVVTTLRQARRPVPEIFIVAVLLRCSYHIYYGVGVIGVAVWATLFVWLFLRYGSIIPLIVIHFLWDASQFLAEKWPAVGAVASVGVLALLTTAFITWLVEFNRRNAWKTRPPVSPPPWPVPPPPPAGDH
ncbi:MAG TPA: CPBP family intramembrane glutamic endopeptidase [Trebonia sp.]|nr:CPBP family intramembrane glutamic endopeptidase [Trebonia sp.]